MAYSFDLDRCNFGFKYNGVSYEFDNITSDVIDNPEEQHITRGSNRKDIRGIRYKVNMNQPIVRTQIIKGIPKDILELLQSIYENGDRLDIYLIDRIDGSSRISKEAVLQKKPYQLNVEEGETHFDIQIISETFDLQEDIKAV